MTKHLNAPLSNRLKSSASRLGLRALEPRILLDAAGFVTGADVAMDAIQVQDVAADMAELFEPQSVDVRAENLPVEQLLQALSDAENDADSKYETGQANRVMDEGGKEYVALAPRNQNDVNDLNTYAGLGVSTDITELSEDITFDLDTPISESVSLVFIDQSVQGWEALAADVPDGFETLFIPEGSDGLQVIRDALATRENVSEIHILSHGTSEQLTLGTTVVTAESLAGEHADDFAAFAASLTESADILIYGCDFGQDSDALSLISNLTGADIAASTDDTGNAIFGGDWTLEVKVGDVESNAIALTSFAGVLAPELIVNGDFSAATNAATDWTLGAGASETQSPGEIQFTSNTASGVKNIFQDITTVIGQEYVLTYDQGTEGAGTALTTLRAAVLDGATVVGERTETLTNGASSVTHSLTFTATSTTTRIFFEEPSTVGTTTFSDPTVDNVSVMALVDTDGDGVADINDIDDDNDGILDVNEGDESNFQIEFNGTFGELSGVGFRDLQSPPGGGYSYGGFTDGLNPAGTYAVVNEAGGNAGHSGAGWAFAGVSGDADDAFLAVNGGTAQGTFFSETVTLEAGVEYDFSFFARSGFPVVNTAGQGFEVEMRVLDSSNNVVATLTTGEQLNLQDWTEFSGSFNTGSETQFTLVVRNLSTSTSGNDFAIDQVNLTPSQGFVNRDTDGDGVFDHLDLDSDNDGISDLEESGSGAVDADNDGVIDDVDGAAAAATGDLNGDGVSDSLNGANLTTDVTAFTLQGNAFLPGFATDRIGFSGDNPAGTSRAFIDVSTVAGEVYTLSYSVGAGGGGTAATALLAEVLDGATVIDSELTNRLNQDPSTDHTISFTATSSTTRIAFSDALAASFNSDPHVFGIELVSVGATPVNTDGDALANFLDLDSDADGIADAIEARATNAQIPLATLADGAAADAADSDNDGILDVFETASGTFGGDFTAPNDDDADGTADYVSTDSDGDGALDSAESGLAGLPADVTYLDADGTLDVTTLPDVDGDDTDVDFRSFTDTDGDGIGDFEDIDDDNDGILDTVEGYVGPVDFTGGTLTNATLGRAGGITVSGAILAGGDTNSGPSGDANGNLGMSVIGGAGNSHTYQMIYSDPVTITVSGMTANANGFFTDNETLTLTTGDGSLITLSDPDGQLLVETSPGVFQTVSSYTSSSISFRSVAPSLAANAGTFSLVTTTTQLDWTQTALDFQNNGVTLNFAVVAGEDTDGDGVFDHLDLDSDNDGISDLVEGGNANLIAADTNNDGTVSLTESSIALGAIGDQDDDGLSDIVDSTTIVGAVSTGVTPVNTDGDTLADYLDLDSDGDGIADAIEARPTTGGNVFAASDTVDANGLRSSLNGSFDTPNDDDADGTANYISTDSDGDGLSDAAESGANGALPADVTYADADGTLDPATLENIDSDNSDVDFRSFQDTDGDGVADFEDIDDDNDGILDSVEERRPPGFQVAVWNNVNFQEGTLTAGDTNFIAAASDLQNLTSGPGLTLTASTIPDGNHIAVDGLDSADLSEAISNDDYIDLTFTADIDTDVINAFMSIYSNGSNPDVAGMNGTWMISLDGGTTFEIFADSDFDNSGIHTDSTASGNDGSFQYQPRLEAGQTATVRLYLHGSPFTSGNIDDLGLTFVSAEVDTDGDGIVDRLDLDSDNDGISDLEESGYGGLDANNDGVLDEMATPALAAVNDADGDGLLESLDNGNEVTPRNTDGDTLADYLDLDSDADTIADAIEARPTSAGNVIDGTNNTDSDGDGIIDAFDTNATFGGDFGLPNDDDLDLTPDYIDQDSDGDLVGDIGEAGLGSLPVDVTYADADGTLDPANLQNIDSDSSDVDFRSLDDVDGDGVSTPMDIDEDNDGILDTEEGVSAVSFTTPVNGNSPYIGTTTLGVDVEVSFDVPISFFPASNDTTFDNPNFSFLSDVDFLPSNPVFFGSGQIDNAFPATMTIDLTGEPVSEVYLHYNSIDQILAQIILPPGIGVELISSISTIVTPIAGGFQIGDIDPVDVDLSVADESLDGLGGGSADGTLRFYSLDGTPITTLEVGLLEDPNRNGNAEGWQFAVEVAIDTDGDGISNHRDLDSDNDGISDLEESGSGGLDANNDGVLDEMATPALAAANDLDGDGLLDSLDNGNEVTPRQTDGDGIADFLDLDSDGDLIADAIEARPTTDGNVITSNVDSDGDGIIDHFDTNATFGGNFTAPVDTDSGSNLNNNPDGLADYIDTDSDGDGILDADESGLPNRSDNNGDGIADDTDYNISYADADGSLVPSTNLDNFVGDTSEVAYRELNQPVIIDLDDDTTTADRDHEVSASVSDTILVNPIAADGGAFDPDSTTVSQIIIEIDEATFLDASDEFFVIAGVDVSLDGDSVPTFAIESTPISVNGNDYTLRVTRISTLAGGPSVQIVLFQLPTQGDGQVELADANDILRGLQYRNDAGANATLGDRVYTVRAFADQNDASTNGNTATGTISLSDAPPIIDLNDDNTTADLDSSTTYTEGDGSLSIIPATADVIDVSNNITSLSVAVAGLVDGGDESFTVNGVTFTQGTDLTDTTASIGGVPVTMAFVGGTLTISATDGVSTLDQAALDTVVRGITYAHGSDDPTEGDRTFSFTATDSNGNNTALAAVATVTVVEVNDAPEGADTTVTATEDTDYTFTAADFGFTDPLDNNSLQSVTVNPLTGTGTLSLNGVEVTAATVVAAADIGLLVYTPVLDENGASIASFTFQVTDDGGTANGGEDTDQTPNTITIDIDPVNDDPVAVDDTAIAPEDGSATGNVITASDSDPDGDTLTVSLVDGVAGNVGTAVAGANGGLFTINSDGSFTFDANGYFEGLDVGETDTTTLTYEVSDGQGGTDMATVTVTVQGANDVPIVTGTLAGQTGHDGVAQVPFDASTVFSDVDVETLSFTSPDLPSWMSISATGEITGTPPADASQGGPLMDGVYTVTVTATDPEGEEVSTTVTYTFTNPPPVVDVPVGAQSNVDGGTVSIPTDFSDPDGDTLSYTATGLPNGLSIDPATGEITGTLDADASQVNGGVYTVTVTADDGEGGTVTDTFDITVTNEAPVIDTPVGPQTADDNAVVSIPTALSDPDGDDLSYTASGLPTGLSIDPVTGEITGTVDPSASQGGPLGDGVYTVIVTADDGQGGMVTDTFTFTVTNPAPVVDMPIGNQTADDADVVSITPSISDPDGDVLTYSVTGLPAGLNIIPSTGEIVGTIDSSASQGGPLGDGVYTVIVTADDGEGGMVTDTFTYTISNPAPDAVDDMANANEGAPITGFVILGSDSDPDQDVLSVSQVNGDPANVGIAVTGSNGGEFIINSDGTFSFDPNGDFDMLDVGETDTTTITYEVSDGEGGTDTATVTITVNGANDAPITTGTLTAQTGTDSVAQVPFDASTVFSDVDAEPLTYSSVNLPSWMSIDAMTGEITGTPPSDASVGGANSDGVYVITVTATDPDGESVDANVVYTFENVAPVAQNDVFTTAEDTPLFVNVIPASDTDPDGDTLVIDMAALPDGTLLPIGTPTTLPEGVLTINADGSVEFDPADNFNGPLTFGYTLSDGQGGTDVATVTINVTDVNDAPELDLNGADTGSDEAIIVANDDPSTPIIPDALITDVDSTTLTSVTGIVGGNADGAGEAFTLGGEDLGIGTGGATFDVTFGGTTFSVVSDGTSFTATVTGGTGDIADVNALMASLEYEHTQNPPTLGDRTVTLSAADDLGLASNDAVVTIRVVADTTAPEPPVVNPPEQEPEGPLTVTGTGEPGSTIKVEFADGTIGTAEIAADGSWSVTSEGVQTTGDVVVTVCDNTGNESPPVTTPFVDNTPPLPPELAEPEQNPDGTLTATGTGEPGAEVTVTFPNGEVVTVTVDPEGNFTAVSTTPQTSGDVTATQTDEAGNESGQDTEDFVDNTPPLPPVVEPPVQDPEGTLTLTGTGEPGSTIKVTFENGETGEALVAADGTWTLTSTTVQNGGDVVLSQCDEVGNESPPVTTPFVDNTPPLPPELNEPEQNPDGTLTVTGTGEPGAEVTLTFPNGEMVTVTVDPEGNFTGVSTTPQTSGDVTATQTDEAGNESGEGTEDFVDNTPPLPPVVEPPVQDPEGGLTVTGTGEPGSTIKVTFADGTVGTALVAADGSWSVTSETVQTTGDVSVVQCDPDGNEGPATETPFVDNEAPLPPTLVVEHNNETGLVDVTGTGEPGAIITVTFPNGETAEVIVDENGNYSTTSKTPQSDGEVVATQADAAGNVSSEAEDDYSSLDIVFVDMGDNGQIPTSGSDSGRASGGDNGFGDSLSDKGEGGFSLQRYFREFFDRTNNYNFERSLDQDRKTGVTVEVPRRGDGTDHLVVATVAFEHNINVQLTAELVNEASVKSWSVTSADGSPLPGWVEYVPGSDFFEMTRPLDQDSIRLRVRAILDNGRTVSKIVEINMRTGVVGDEGGTFNQAQTLSDQFTLEMQQLVAESEQADNAQDALLKALAG